MYNRFDPYSQRVSDTRSSLVGLEASTAKYESSTIIGQEQHCANLKWLWQTWQWPSDESQDDGVQNININVWNVNEGRCSDRNLLFVETRNVRWKEE